MDCSSVQYLNYNSRRKLKREEGEAEEMAKFNVVQKAKRKFISDRKRVQKGDPVTAKLKHKPQPLSVSGKRQRKLLKKWRRDQKEAVEKGLITMEDVEMSLAEPEGSGKSAPAPKAFSMKKGVKLNTKRSKQQQKGKGKRKSSKSAAAVTAQAIGDAMVEE